LYSKISAISNSPLDQHEYFYYINRKGFFVTPDYNFKEDIITVQKSPAKKAGPDVNN
jgi:hypothetical protein